MFRAGGAKGLISASGEVVERQALHRLMAQLTERIRAEEGEAANNPRIPAGYTYLLQFVAHDMVDSVVSFSIDQDALSPSTHNARQTPLLLDTLYGGGPDECPQAYELSQENFAHSGQVPRTRLRLGPPPQGSPPQGKHYCPFRDIARGKTNSGDRGLASSAWLTETMIADPRNDAHALVSQLTVVFQLLHNHVVDMLEKPTAALETSVAYGRLERRELAYRRFRCARLVVALIYRNIIEKDLLRRILDDRIYEHYVTKGHAPFDSGESIPVEFTFGAFRFGHAMVRESYLINDLSTTALETDMALRLTSQRKPDRLPMPAIWQVDWARFFELERFARPNLSKVLGPRYPAVLESETGLFAKLHPVDAGGLAHRDLLSACYAGTLSVPALCQALRAKGFRIVEDFAVWRQRLEAWLPKHDLHFPPDGEDIKRVVEDPPLPFFVLFEANHHGGRHLGPLGSIIVAETMLGVMRCNPLGVEQSGSTLKERIQRCSDMFFNEPEAATPVASALADIDEIETMPQLLSYMRGQRLFGQASSPKWRETMDPITIDSYLRWGKLIKTWATGRSYFENENPSISIDRLPVPRSLEELKVQCSLVRAGVAIPPGIVGLAVVQYSADTLVIRLPPKERVEAMERSLAASGRYPFPGYYTDFMGRDLTAVEKLDAHACRIGDYTISYCG
jgi:hypothetical protein